MGLAESKDKDVSNYNTGSGDIHIAVSAVNGALTSVGQGNETASSQYGETPSVKSTIMKRNGTCSTSDMDDSVVINIEGDEVAEGADGGGGGGSGGDGLFDSLFGTEESSEMSDLMDYGYTNEDDFLHDLQRENSEVVCIEIANSTYAEVSRLNRAEMKTLTAQINQMELEEEGDVSTAYNIDREFIEKAENELLEEGGCENLSESSSQQPCYLSMFPYLSVGKNKQIVKLTEVVYVRSTHPAAKLYRDVQEKFNYMVADAVSDETKEITMSEVMDVIDNEEKEGREFCAVSSDVFLALECLSEKHKKAIEKIDAFLDECKQDTNEFNATEIKSRLQKIRNLLLNTQDGESDTEEKQGDGTEGGDGGGGDGDGYATNTPSSPLKHIRSSNPISGESSNEIQYPDLL